MRAELGEVFKLVDFIITPTAPTPAFKIGEKKISCRCIDKISYGTSKSSWCSGPSLFRWVG